MRSVKTRIAAIATVLGLAGLTGVALNAGGQGSSQQATKPLVRTKVIRRTIHVTKHAKPKHSAVAAAAPPASIPVAAASSGAAAEEPVTTATSGTGSEEPVTTAASGTGGEPVTTATSGTGGGGEEEHEVDYESEGGGEGFDD